MDKDKWEINLLSDYKPMPSTSLSAPVQTPSKLRYKSVITLFF